MREEESLVGLKIIRFLDISLAKESPAKNLNIG